MAAVAIGSVVAAGTSEAVVVVVGTGASVIGYAGIS